MTPRVVTANACFRDWQGWLLQPTCGAKLLVVSLSAASGLIYTFAHIAYRTGNTDKLIGGLVPKAVTNIIKAARGYPVNAKGEPSGPEYTTSEKIRKSLGFQPARQAEATRADWREKTLKRQQSIDSGKLRDAFYQATDYGDKLKAYNEIQMYNHAHRDTPITDATLKRGQTERLKQNEERRKKGYATTKIVPLSGRD